ncbi:MAG: Gfo/Idh/MocA family protein [Chloroflexota bacterium]|jgi:predicted dehydrogenase
METLKVGIIGYGYWGPNLARNFFELPSAELTAVADLKEERLKHAHSLYPNTVITNEYTDLFNMDLNAVVVSTPPALHYSIAKNCLEHGLNVLVEKPLTLNSKDAQELIDLAEEKKLTLMVGHTFEYNSAVHALKHYMDSGELGDVYYIDMARLNLGLFQRDSNVLWDLAPHDLSILFYLLGDSPLTVSAHGTPCVFNGIYDVAYVNLTFPSGISAHIHVSWLDPCKVRRITVVGSKKMIVYNDIENEQKLKIYDKGVDAPAYTDGFEEFHCNYRSGDIVIPRIRFVEPLRQECSHFLDCISSHNQPCSSGVDGLRVVKVLEAAQHSMTNGSGKEVLQW